MFTTCVLSGLHTLPSFYDARLHAALYSHVKTLLGPALLASPVAMETVLAMLMLAAWNISPPQDLAYIDSWLMSGNAIMQRMLGSNLEIDEDDTSSDSTEISHHSIRVWNYLYLIHLK